MFGWLDKVQKTRNRRNNSIESKKRQDQDQGIKTGTKSQTKTKTIVIIGTCPNISKKEIMGKAEEQDIQRGMKEHVIK